MNNAPALTINPAWCASTIAIIYTSGYFYPEVAGSEELQPASTVLMRLQ